MMPQHYRQTSGELLLEHLLYDDVTLTFHGVDVGGGGGLAEPELSGELLLEHLLHGESLSLGQLLLVTPALFSEHAQPL